MISHLARDWRLPDVVLSWSIGPSKGKRMDMQIERLAASLLLALGIFLAPNAHAGEVTLNVTQKMGDVTGETIENCGKAKTP